MFTSRADASKRYILAAVATLLLFCGAHRANADQIETLSFQGPAYNFTNCTDSGFDPSKCLGGGSVTGLVTVVFPDNFSGWSDTSWVRSFAMSASGVGTVTSDLSQGQFLVQNGVITDWFWSVGDAFIQGKSIRTTGADNDYDSGVLYSGGSVLQAGVVIHPPTGYWTNGKFLGASCDIPGAVTCGNPINIGSGNKYEQVTDYETAGQNKLDFSRYYNSYATTNTYATTLGRNWRSTFDRYLQFISGDQIEAERADGRLLTFISSGSWVTDTDVDYSLAYSSGNYLLTDPDDTVETYTSAGGKGQLSSIKYRGGYTQTLSYNSSGQLSSVSDSYSRTLGFSYSSAGLLTGLTTPDTLALTYGYTMYSSANMLTSVSYNTSPATSIQYKYENTSFPYALTGLVDEDGNRYATWQYDSSGRAVLSQHAGGIDEIQVAYDDSTGNRTVTGPLGIQETYVFTTLQGVPKVTEIDRASNGTVAYASSSFSYDTNGYLASVTDWNGNQTSYTNNSHGDPTTIVFASGSGVSRTTTIAYSSAYPHLPVTITAPDVTQTLTYDSSGRLLTNTLTDKTSTSVPYFTSGQFRTWNYTWNSTGQLLSVQLPRTDVTAKTTYGYTGGTLTSITDALSHATTVLTYKSGGWPLTVTDPNSVLTTLSYTPRNWLTSSVLSLSSGGTLTTSLTYDSAGNLTKFTRPDNSYLSYGYNAARQLTSITNRLSESQAITYNSAGNITQVLWKDSGGTTTRQHTATYDALGRMLTDVGGMSQSTAFTYDNNGNTLTVTDPLSHVTTNTYDALNRLSTITDAATDLTTLTYDAHNNVLTVTDPRSKVTSYVYDGFGDVIQETSPERGTTVLTYSSDFLPLQQTDANGYVTNMTYDALDRILTRAYPADSTLNVAFTYDQTGHGKGIGHLTSLTDAPGSLSLNYEERGLVTSNARTISSKVYTTAFSYESAGRLSTLTYASSGWLVTYARDNAGQVSSVTAKAPSTSAVNLATSVTHMPFGPLKSLTYGNGVTDARTFDLDYRMTSVKDVGTSNIQYSSYGYNANNNVTSITDNVTSANNQAFVYDVVNRFTSGTGVYGTKTATFDSAGNMLTYAGTTFTYSSASNRMSASGANSVSYNSAGNITAIGTTPTFTYNKANQMATAVVSGTTSTYTYDAFGQRLKTVTGANPANIQSYGLDGSVLTESNSNVETDYAYLDGIPLAAIQPAAATISAIHTDRLATPQKATNSSKTVVWTGNYQPFGLVSPTASITMNLRFRGQYADVTGFSHNGFRDYNPNFGRYLEFDPIGLAGGINGYPYALSNPIRYVDPSGLISLRGIFAAAALTAEVVGEVTGAGEVAAPVVAAQGEAAVVGAAAVPFMEPPAAIEPPQAASGQQCTLSQPTGIRPANPVTRNYTSQPQTVDQVLSRASQELGQNYKELDLGVYRSENGAGSVQFRMRPPDIAPRNGEAPHVHFERFEPGQTIPYENEHVPLTDE